MNISRKDSLGKKLYYITTDFPNNLCDLIKTAAIAYLAIFLTPITYLRYRADPEWYDKKTKRFGNRNTDTVAMSILWHLLLLYWPVIFLFVDLYGPGTDPVPLFVFFLPHLILTAAGFVVGMFFALTSLLNWLETSKNVVLRQIPQKLKSKSKSNIIVEYIKSMKEKTCIRVTWTD